MTTAYGGIRVRKKLNMKVMKNKKVLLIIMDGWGEGDKSKADVIDSAC